LPLPSVRRGLSGRWTLREIRMVGFGAHAIRQRPRARPFGRRFGRRERGQPLGWPPHGDELPPAASRSVENVARAGKRDVRRAVKGAAKATESISRGWLGRTRPAHRRRSGLAKKRYDDVEDRPVGVEQTGPDASRRTDLTTARGAEDTLESQKKFLGVLVRDRWCHSPRPASWHATLDRRPRDWPSGAATSSSMPGRPRPAPRVQWARGRRTTVDLDAATCA